MAARAISAISVIRAFQIGTGTYVFSIHIMIAFRFLKWYFNLKIRRFHDKKIIPKDDFRG